MLVRILLRATLGVAIGLGLVASGCVTALAATDGPYQDVYYVNSCSQYGNTAPTWTATPAGLQTTDGCNQGSGLEIESTGNNPSFEQAAQWGVETPDPSLRIVDAYSEDPQIECGLHHDGYDAEYRWGDNGVFTGSLGISVDCGGAYSGFGGGTAIGQYLNPSARYFQFEASCDDPSGCSDPQDTGNVVAALDGIELEVQETGQPTIQPGVDDLMSQTGWVRGDWPTSFTASDPSGVCATHIIVNTLFRYIWNDAARDLSQWNQCGDNGASQNLDTTTFPDGTGTISLEYTAMNAADALATLTRSINVDNSPVTVAMPSGPDDVVATGGRAELPVSASAGPSGVQGIFCSVDGAAAVEYSPPKAEVPVNGYGRHQVSCYATNNAVSYTTSDQLLGQLTYGQSASDTTIVNVQQPVAAAATFARIADALRCKRKIVHVKVRGRGGRVHRVKRRERICHARTVRRRVTVTVTRHGRKVKVHRIERVAVLPHALDKPRRRVAFGHGTTVSGYLELAGGTPLAGRHVQVLAAPNDAQGRYAPIASVVTNANGTWTAKVPPGPSRLIEASYAGDAADGPAVSAPVRLTVPAAVSLRVSPAQTHWGGSVRISGRLKGGHIPRRGELVVLKIGYDGGTAEIGHVETTRRGRFSVPYHFLRGSGHDVYRLWAETVAESGYPFAPGRSRDVAISVGP